jgi:amino acid transporter
MSIDSTGQSPGHRAIGAGEPRLVRSLGLGLLVLYGLGVTVGAGIYVLVGAAAGRAGVHAPVAFLIAAFVMSLSAASFAELAVRFPVSAGEAAYVEAGLRSRKWSLLTGMLVIAAAIIAAAAIAQGAAGYIGVLVPLPPSWLVAGVVIVMGMIAAWGISEAVAVAAAMTIVEICGLLTIVIAGLRQNPAILSDLPLAFHGLESGAVWPGILGASLVAFFAFIGFEGMVNVAEEVKQPERTVPLAIGLTLVISTMLYILVVWVVIRSVPEADLARSAAPLSLTYERLTGASPLVISLIAILATINGVIIQIIMASRVVYGLACRGALPSLLGRVDPRTKTPLVATALVVAVTLGLSLALPIDRLADFTTRVMLVVFALVNVALVAIKVRGDRGTARENDAAALDGEGGKRSFAVPFAVPVLGAITCMALLIADFAR